MRVRSILILALCLALSACRTAPPAAKGTGARETAAKYFDALVKQDWDAAYAQLHPETRKQIDRAGFERRGVVYCKKVGFPLGAFAIRTCDEQGTKAIAQITLTDAANSAKHRYRDGLVLQSTGDGWAVVLAANFGKR